MQHPNKLKRLPPSFFEQPTLELAKALLGSILIKETNDGTAAGIITETEAYIGPGDQAAHSYQNRRTKRTEVMFGLAGFTYMYTMHTHYLFNVVTGQADNPEAILIRSVEPYFNKELMQQRRPKARNDYQLTNGPGKLTKALGIDMNDYGHPLHQKPLWIAKGELDAFTIASGSRIGIDNSGEAKDYPWRFWIKGNRYVSR
ncbi:DNA-3-methyladenine glycosylase [Aquibacillus salsiterrae]|uniref:Putative 3-methyladenine DNA glycosylase n=1 Tax=Aquibacillus salsiterrae TaxID=2950439 RepID=A0A9X3WER8_9BACI|nr:DNA-3-methyladenine glycosylase [Aquibacillus salsiterrae]MDC3417111.1 DNA-3-methyladenine glycosylase [Aquibacillus salsiterrae]